MYTSPLLVLLAVLIAGTETRATEIVTGKIADALCTTTSVDLNAGDVLCVSPLVCYQTGAFSANPNGMSSAEIIGISTPVQSGGWYKTVDGGDSWTYQIHVEDASSFGCVGCATCSDCADNHYCYNNQYIWQLGYAISSDFLTLTMQDLLFQCSCKGAYNLDTESLESWSCAGKNGVQDFLDGALALENLPTVISLTRDDSFTPYIDSAQGRKYICRTSGGGPVPEYQAESNPPKLKEGEEVEEPGVPLPTSSFADTAPTGGVGATVPTVSGQLGCILIMILLGL